MKKYIKKIMLFLSVFVFLIGINLSYGETDDFEQKRIIDNLEKEWTISFNMDIDKSTVTNDNIYILDNMSNILDTKLIILDKQVIVSPENSYNINQEYTLFIKNIKGKEGSGLKKDINMPFEVNIEQENSDKEFLINNIGIGDNIDTVINNLGNPNEKIDSLYGFKWYVYSSNYSEYTQIGILDDKVQAIFSSGLHWCSNSGVKVGTKKSSVKNIYKEELEYSLETKEKYNFDEYNATFFYDKYADYSLESVFLMKDGILKNNNITNDSLEKTFEIQIFHLANASRAKKEKKPFLWDDKIAKVAKDHSADMLENDYFSHTNLEGKSPFDRMMESGISYSLAAENIAYGYRNAIDVHFGWINSKGHRNNILGECDKLGVGVEYDGESIYYTQNFYTPR